ncbi:MAG: methyltransferase domain-containing protein [Fimbriimonadaceae bacterium]|nr:methyltransferase domain-containing protein [Alphaproteobacteria bacterium]
MNKQPRNAQKTERRGLSDKAHFSKAIAKDPKTVGAVAPSGRPLARMMAAQVDQSVPGTIIELGPGTGSITDALLEAGIPEERLLLVEASPDFYDLLRVRYPRATVIRGDAFAIREIVAAHLDGAPAAIVSGLPLFNQPAARRAALIDDAMKILAPGGAFVQFSYHVLPPVRRGAFDLRGTRRVWWNLFPARVWVYSPEQR